MVFGNNKNRFGNKEESVEVPMKTAILENEPLDLNSTAFSVIKHPESGYALVTLSFNPITMKAKVDKVERVGDNREDGEHYFRVAVGQYFADQERKS